MEPFKYKEGTNDSNVAKKISSWNDLIKRKKWMKRGYKLINHGNNKNKVGY